jgi:uncharacterized protein (DUF427 family)
MQPQRIEPGPGQESVWDYPRPPRVEASQKRVQIVFNDVVIADTTQAQRVLETSHPPVYYIPPEAIQPAYFHPTTQTTFCEWKGIANYFTITLGNKTAPNAAWVYHNPTPHFAAIQNHIAVYPSRMDSCYLDGEQVQAQPGDFYGGWITQDIIGPFKGEPGTWGW